MVPVIPSLCSAGMADAGAILPQDDLVLRPSRGGTDEEPGLGLRFRVGTRGPEAGRDPVRRRTRASQVEADRNLRLRLCQRDAMPFDQAALTFGPVQLQLTGGRCTRGARER